LEAVAGFGFLQNLFAFQFSQHGFVSRCGSLPLEETAEEIAIAQALLQADRYLLDFSTIPGNTRRLAPARWE
jgi:hypothetical protein